MFKARNRRECHGVDEFTMLKWTARICGVDVDMIIYPRIGASCYVLRTRYSDRRLCYRQGNFFIIIIVIIIINCNLVYTL